jgi:hypothetical protein
MEFGKCKYFASLSLKSLTWNKGVEFGKCKSFASFLLEVAWHKGVKFGGKNANVWILSLKLLGHKVSPMHYHKLISNKCAEVAKSEHGGWYVVTAKMAIWLHRSNLKGDEE